MPITLHPTPYGPPAHEALARTVEKLKGGDPLTPVAVIVPSNHVGIAARRALGARGGIAAVTFLTPYRLAELLGSGRLAAEGRRPVSTPVLAGAVRAVLAEEPGHFAAVATHPATERSLVRAHRALSEVGPAGLAAVASTGARSADVVRVHRAVRRRLGSRFSDEQDLVAAAIEALAAGSPVLTALGAAVLFLPQRMTSSQLRLLGALADTHGITVLAGDSGDIEADRPVRAALTRLGADWPTPDTLFAPEPVVPATADEIVSVSDADDEVRHAVREMVAAALDGTPLARCAIVYGTHDPYARLIGDALDAAGIPWFGASVRTAESSLPGRSLLALLALPDHDWSRRDVAAWLAGAPIRVGNRPAPVAAWERMAREAGVVAGAEQWVTRLGRLREEREAEAADLARDDEQEWRAERRRRDAAHAEELSAFVAGLVEALDPGGRAGSWSGLASWCRGLVRTYLGGEPTRESWPAEEQAAARRVDAAIDRLADLDGIDPAPSVTAFRRALELQLADDLGRHGTFGDGVLVGPAALAIGVELDRVVVVGMAEGSFPARRRDDPLLPDRVRVVAGPDLPPRADAVHDDHRALLAVLAAAGRSVFTFPRGDLRRSAERAPSRWLLDTIEARAGVRPSADELDRATPDWCREVPSFVAGLRTAPFPATAQEFDVRSLLDVAEQGSLDAVAELPVMAQRPEVGRGVALLRARLSSDFTRFDGNLAAGDLRGASVPAPTDPGQVTSATRLETWAACPHAYFVRSVLGVVAVDDPEEQYRIHPLTRGTLVHDTLDRWLGDALAAGTVPGPGAPWPDADRARLVALGAAEADRLEAKGLVGRAVYWHRDRRTMLADLAAFVDQDDRLRAAHGARPLATELPFGMPHDPTPPVTLTLPSGRRLVLRGSIDRVDETADGTLVVIDYKTGKSKPYEGLSADDPTPGGTHLQLVLYAAAARAVLGRPEAAATGAYWFVSGAATADTAGYRIDPEVERRALATVDRIVDGIAAGLFPLHPDPPGWRMFVPCEYCEPDGLGLSHQYADWQRIHDHPDLAPYLDLVEPETAG